MTALEAAGGTEEAAVVLWEVLAAVGVAPSKWGAAGAPRAAAKAEGAGSSSASGLEQRWEAWEESPHFLQAGAEGRASLRWLVKRQ